MTDRVAAGHKPPEVRFYLPAAPLRPLVTSYYIVDAPGPLVDFTHPEWGNIRFLLAGDARFGDRDGGDMTPPPPASIFGPTDRTRCFDSQRRANAWDRPDSDRLAEPDRQRCVASGQRDPAAG